MVWLLLSVASVLKFYVTTSNVLMPFERINILILDIKEVLRGDVPVFMVVFLVAMSACYFLLFIVFPHHPELPPPPQVPGFKAWWSALFSIFQTGFTGEPITLPLDTT